MAVQECDYCDAEATQQLTFVLPNARTNPASTGYGRDDISWCSDAKAFVCEDCARRRHEIGRELGMEWCASFQNGERFGHLFKVKGDADDD